MLNRVALTAFVGLIAFTASSRADIDIEVANGQKVRGTIDPVDETETLTLCIPGGSTLTVIAKGKKEKGGNPAPVVSFKVLDAGDAEISAGKVIEKGVGAKLKKLPIPTTGKYRVVIEAASVGNYEAKIKWKSPKKFTETVTATDTGVGFEFGVDADATCTFQAKASKGSEALPVLESVDLDGGDTVHNFTPPAAGSKKHKEKGIVLEDAGDHDVYVSSNGPDGDVDLLIKVKAPKTDKKAVVEISAKQLGTADARGKVIGPAGDTLSITDGALGDLLGAAVIVPRGALGKPTAIIIGKGLDVPVNGEDPGGPAVFFGPEGLRFGSTAQIILPFNPDLFDDEGDVQIAVRDVNGKITLISISDFTVNLEAGTATVDVSHFSTYQVVGAGEPASLPVAGDLNGDGFADVLVPTAGESGLAQKDRIEVFFGGPALAPVRASSSFDARFTEQASSSRFGEYFATGDLTGDGVDDLVITAWNENDRSGRAYVYFGGAGFAQDSTTPLTDADIVITGQGDEQFGGSVVIADILGDGTSDLIVSSSGEEPSFFGRIYVFDGSTLASGGSNDADVVIEATADFAELRALAGGDVDGDQRADLVAGHRFTGVNDGLYVFPGGALFDGASTLSPSSASILITGVPGAQFPGRVLLADVVGDDTLDLLAEAPVENQSNAVVHVFQGGTFLINDTTPGAPVSISKTNGAKFLSSFVGGNTDTVGKDELFLFYQSEINNDKTAGSGYVFDSAAYSGDFDETAAREEIEGTESGAEFGHSALMGDVNGDGKQDLWVMAPFSQVGGSDAGRVHVFLGPNIGTGFPADQSGATQVITGTAGQALGSRIFELDSKR